MAQLESSDPIEHLNRELKKLRDVPWYPKEILAAMNLLQLGDVVKKRDDDYYYPITYGTNRCRIQTPILQCISGLQQYTTKGSPDLKYSIHLSLGGRPSEDVKKFREMLETIDDYMLCSINLPPTKYLKCIKHNYSKPSLPPVLQVKIPNIEDCLSIEIFDKDVEYVCPKYEFAAGILKHKTYVQCILELRNLWVAGNRWGISYKLIQIQTVRGTKGPLFRAAV
jgi:hypothetical protein